MILGFAMLFAVLVGTRPPLKNPSIKGEISFENVTFSYGKETILDQLSLTLPEGACVAFVGPSGAGKSTLINLIPRFYDVTGGSILIDGQDIRTMRLEDLRASIALVSQDIALFDGTIAENISYGRITATLDEIIAASKRAAAHSFIQKLGYETRIGENGVRLSGGQRQRLSIARAMLKDAPIILLDEATSSLDTESERQVQESLKQLMKGRTTILVAHRLTTVTHVDKIYVMDHGRIIQSGSHHELIKKEGLYKDLWVHSQEKTF